MQGLTVKTQWINPLTRHQSLSVDATVYYIAGSENFPTFRLVFHFTEMFHFMYMLMS